MLSENLLQRLNEQVNFEFYSSYTYLAMAAYAESVDLSGFANFFFSSSSRRIIPCNEILRLYIPKKMALLN